MKIQGKVKIQSLLLSFLEDAGIDNENIQVKEITYSNCNVELTILFSICFQEDYKTWKEFLNKNFTGHISEIKTKTGFYEFTAELLL